jgi:uncharacterized protein (DUF362 family)/NAD-dependent dihydropyrimidine dehydrogenase PreA subunit
LNRVLVRKFVALEQTVTEVFDFLGFDFVGKKVWVKPNLLAPHPPERSVTTNPELIRLVVSELKRRGASQIWVGDNPAGVHKTPLEQYLKPTGVVEAAEGHFVNPGLEVFNLPLRSRFVPEIPVSGLVQKADVILNLPVFKTHGLTVITGAVKNIFGIIPGGHKTYLHSVARNGREFAELLVDIYQAVPIPILNIMDGIRGMDGPNGPSGGRVLKLGMVIASRNAVALDAVMVLLAGGKPERIPLLQIATERGLSPIGQNEIEIAGDFQPIRGFRLPPVELASAVSKVSTLIYPLLRRTPHLNRRRCIQCGECALNCPVKAINLAPYPVVNRKKCIACFCCAEICPVQAMAIASLPKSLLLRILGTSVSGARNEEKES